MNLGRRFIGFMGAVLALYFLLSLCYDLLSPERSQADLLPVRTYTSRYDQHFQKYTRTYFGRFSWRLFKAQAIQESGLNPDARSPVGALGLMQIMPETYKSIRRQVKLGPNPLRPGDNIHAGIFYDLQCFNEWQERRSMKERIRLMLASYNSGLGNILAAQKWVRGKQQCDGVDWGCIRQGLPHVTGVHAQETIEYVDRVQLFYEQL